MTTINQPEGTDPEANRLPSVTWLANAIYINLIAIPEISASVPEEAIRSFAKETAEHILRNWAMIQYARSSDLGDTPEDQVEPNRC